MNDGPRPSVVSVVAMAPNDVYHAMNKPELPDIMVVRVGPASKGSFATQVRDALAERWPGRLRIATVGISEIDHKNDWVRFMIQGWRRQIGWADSTHVPAGYYLFRKGTLLAYQDGTPTEEERRSAFSHTTYEGFVAAMEASAVNRVARALAEPLIKLEAAEAAAKAQEERKAKEAAKKLADAIAAWNVKAERKRMAALRKPLTAKDRAALKLLGVPEDYTPEEIKAAKRKGQLRVHPDVSKLSPVESTRQSAAYNDAFDTLNRRVV